MNMGNIKTYIIMLIHNNNGKISDKGNHNRMHIGFHVRRLVVLTAVTREIAVFWDTMPHNELTGNST
jgi:hypothetical protein